MQTDWVTLLLQLFTKQLVGTATNNSNNSYYFFTFSVLEATFTATIEFTFSYSSFFPVVNAIEEPTPSSSPFPALWQVVFF